MGCDPLIGQQLVPLQQPVDPGAAPMLAWIKLRDLVVDRSYQREILAAGRRNVDRIARAFSWSKFGTVIVAPIEGGKYAIVDGQHRSTAAFLAGIEQVPCQVVILDRAGQAAAFNAINGTITKVRRETIHRAALLAGDPTALAIDEVCRRAEVRILASPKPAEEMKAGETMAVVTIGKCLETYGQDLVVTALQCVTQSGEGNPGCLNSTVIKGLCLMLLRRGDWLNLGGVLLEAFDHVDFEDLHEKALSNRQGLSSAGKLADLLEAAVLPRLSKSVRAA